MKRLLFQCLMALTVVCFQLSCADEQNFDQFDDLSVTPTLASSVFYLESTEEVINTAPTGTFYSQVFTFEAFNEEFVAERLLEGVILYEVENTTSKRLDLTIEYLDENDGILATDDFSIEPLPAPLLTYQVTYGPGGRSLDVLRNTTNLRVTGQNLSDNTSVSSEAEPKVVLRAAAEFRFRLK
nr:hypothetical protein [Allomuricauda sp.]